MSELLRIDELNRRFGIPGVAEVVAGNGGMAKVRISTELVRAEMYLHGSHVTAWKPAGAEEAIFMSERSQWQDGSPIRGGIPICFPWFRAKADDPQAPMHGFVRTKEWKLDSITAETDGTVIVGCSTASDESTRRWWPHDFRLVHWVSFGRVMRMELRMSNTGKMPLRFEEALHTYFRVGSAEKVRVRGLDGVAFLDNTDGNRRNVQAGDVVFVKKTDNAYLDTRSAVEVIDPVLGRRMRTEKEHSATTIVWNPWTDGAAAMPDFGAEEWRVMTCVEASNIMGFAVELGPGEEHVMVSVVSGDSGVSGVGGAAS